MTTVETTQEGGSVPWWLVFLEGIAAVIIGIFLLTSPGATLFVLIQILAIYWFISGIFSIISIFINSEMWGWKLFVGILGIIAGVIAITIGMAIRAEITGEGKEDIEGGRADVRDKEIERHGEARAQHFTSFGATTAIILAMCGAHQFWIASALIFAGALGGFYGGIVRIMAYRRGF